MGIYFPIFQKAPAAFFCYFTIFILLALISANKLLKRACRTVFGYYLSFHLSVRARAKVTPASGYTSTHTLPLVYKAAEIIRVGRLHYLCARVTSEGGLTFSLVNTLGRRN